ncbi:MAG: CPBP family intramembrane metalloprotease [Anaerolineae bacterium]|nr:CPBP family intramembrane metalloprotease [Anaerolineae bacterium]
MARAAELHGSPLRIHIALAWTVALLASSLGDIVAYELTGGVPLWLSWAKAGLLVALITLGSFWRAIKPLRPFFVILLALAILMGAHGWLLAQPAVVAWQGRQSFAIAALSLQVLEMGVALLLIGVLFVLRRRREAFFLVRGDLDAVAQPVRWLGQKTPGPLSSFGLLFTLVVVVAQVLIFIVPLSPSAGTLRRLLPLAPVIVLLAISNGFNEEVMLRAAPVGPVFEVVGTQNAIWMAAVLFGLSHYIGGIPSGIPGVVITTFLGWFFGKCMVDSKGLFWPWLFHAVQDILPFTFAALVALSAQGR